MQKRLSGVIRAIACVLIAFVCAVAGAQGLYSRSSFIEQLDLAVKIAQYATDLNDLAEAPAIGEQIARSIEAGDTDAMPRPLSNFAQDFLELKVEEQTQLTRSFRNRSPQASGQCSLREGNARCCKTP